MERTPGFHRKAPTEELKTMFYSFMKQTLSCVQISSFHCLWYLREEQTAGSSLDASTEDLFYFSPPRKLSVYLYRKELDNASIFLISNPC